ncbi:MAG: CRISPR-associated protein Csx11, partial [candidate division KSB1 bacterium]|nr:CRISPR-associated protein Csx11 [candidate division KSB1 bacterium]
EVVAKIKENYETEMGKVRNRLSLTLGIIYFHRRTPLRAALEAGRQMLKIPTEQKVWKVQRIDHNAIYFNNGSKWGVPITLGDGNLDYYYPYFFDKTPAQDHPLDQRPNRFESYRPTPNGNERCWLVHVSELKPGDEVWVIPSQFDFEFLDTSARRFEICYGNNGRRRGFHQNRPYLLEDLDVLKQLWKLLAGENGLTTTQINALTGLIEAKREMWRYPTNDAQKDKVFEQLVKDALARAEWPNGWINIPAESRTLLEKAAINGVLTDVLELYMELMKEKPKRT